MNVRLGATRCRQVAAWFATAAACVQAGAATVTMTVRDADARALPDAVVAVFVDGTPRLARSPQVAEIVQRGKQFIPSVLAVQSGTPVSFPNFDTVRHHVYSFAAIKTFEIKLYVGRPEAPVVFDQPGTAALGCNIHDSMSAFIRVVDTPYFGRTDADGRVRLELPSGAHRVQVWHPRLPLDTEPPLQALKVANEAATVTLALDH